MTPKTSKETRERLAKYIDSCKQDGRSFIGCTCDEVAELLSNLDALESKLAKRDEALKEWLNVCPVVYKEEREYTKQFDAIETKTEALLKSGA